MNPEIKNDLANNEAEDERNEDIDIEVESDDESVELDESDEEYFQEIYSEILEALNRNAEHMRLLQKTLNSFKLELFDMKRLWYCRFFKEIEKANDVVDQVEDELFELSD